MSILSRPSIPRLLPPSSALSCSLANPARCLPRSLSRLPPFIPARSELGWPRTQCDGRCQRSYLVALVPRRVAEPPPSRAASRVQTAPPPDLHSLLGQRLWRGRVRQLCALFPRPALLASHLVPPNASAARVNIRAPHANLPSLRSPRAEEDIKRWFRFSCQRNDVETITC